MCSAGAGTFLLAAQAAQAELPRLQYEFEGFDIRLSGGVAGQVAAFSDDDATTKSPDAQVDLFARLNIQWTSPDGLIIGANIQENSRRRESEVLEAGEIYGFVASEYGRLEVGRQDGPADTLAFAAPLVALGQVRGEFSSYAGSRALLRPIDTRDDFKVIYLSPPIEGLRGGISWSPEANQNQDAENPRSRVIVKDAFELGLQYQQVVGDWILGASGSYAFGNADPITTRADLSSWSVGVDARRGPLRIGGAYVDRGDSNRLARGFDQWEINGGIGWVETLWGVAASTAYTKASDRENRLFGLGGYYRVSPNIELRADLVQFREERFGLSVDDGIVGIFEVQLSI